MKRSLTVPLLSAILLMLFGSWTVAHAQPVDFAFFDGTNPAEEFQPDGGAECIVSGAATLHASVTSDASSPPAGGFVRLTYQDNDWVQFPIEPKQTLQLTQAIGRTSGIDRRVRLSARDVGFQQGAAAPKLVGSLSAISLSTGGTVECRSCKFNDPGGNQNPPDVANQLDCHNNP